MAVVAAGSLVLFSVFAQRTALSPGSGGMVVPSTAPLPPGLEFLEVPRPERAERPVAVPNRPSSEPVSPESDGAVAQVDPGVAPSGRDDRVLVASVDVGVPAAGGRRSRIRSAAQSVCSQPRSPRTRGTGR